MTKARDLASGGFGLVLVKPSSVVNGTDNGKGTVSFTSVSSLSLNGVFNSTYNNYKMIIDYQVSAAFPKIRLRANGSDATSADYSWQSFQFSNTTVDVRRNTGDTTWDISASVGNNVTQFIELELYNPFASSLTWGFAKSYQSGSGQFNNFRMNTSTSYDGFTLYPSTSTMTGTISVYGYNK